MNSLIPAEEPMFTGKQLWRLIWPLLVEQLLSVLVGMVDVLMVSYVGEATVSGVSLVDSVNHLMIQVLFAMTAGGTVVCAGYIGAKDIPSAKKSVALLIEITALVMLLISLIFLFSGKGILMLLFGKAEKAVMDNAAVYMRYTALSFPFLALYHSTAALFRTKGNTKLSMMVSLGMNIFNIAGNALCIFGLGMGVEGVAIPTLLARMAAAFAMLIFLQASNLKIEDLSSFMPDRKIIGQILSIGIPAGVESALFNLGKVMLQSLVSTLGTASIAAYAVAGNLVNYLYLPGNALGAAMTTVVSQCRGAGKNGQARQYTKLLVLLDYALAAVLASALIIGRDFFTGLYNLSPVSSSLAQGLVLAHSLAMIIWPIAFMLPYYYRASGRAAFTMVVAISAMAVFRVGLAYLFVNVFHKNVLWVWYAMFADWIFRVFVYGISFLREKNGQPG